VSKSRGPKPGRRKDNMKVEVPKSRLNPIMGGGREGRQPTMPPSKKEKRHGSKSTSRETAIQKETKQGGKRKKVTHNSNFWGGEAKRSRTFAKSGPEKAEQSLRAMAS